MSEHILNITSQEATRITNTTKTLLDHILVNNTDFYCISGTIDPGLSDHKLVYVTRKRIKPKGDTSYFTGRSYRNFDEALFYHDVYNINWLPLYMITDLDTCTEYFTSMLLRVINTHAPYKKIKCRANQPKWVNGDFLSLIDEKEHLCHVYNKNPTQFNAARKRESERRVKQMKRVLKREFIDKALSDCQGDSKKTWKVIKNLWPGKSKATNITRIGDTSLAFDMANELNSHFSSAGKRICEQTVPTIEHLRAPPSTENKPELVEISIEDIWDILKCLSPSKATGSDDIPARLI